MMAANAERLVDWVIPDLDILLRIFSRRHPDLTLIQNFKTMVRERRVIILGWVKQALYERCQQQSQMHRLASYLRYYPDVSVTDADYERLAERRFQLREQGVTASSRQLLLWVIADRVQARIWSLDKHWLSLQGFKCPLLGDLIN